MGISVRDDLVIACTGGLNGTCIQPARFVGTLSIQGIWGWIGACMICFLASAFTRQTYLLSGPLAGFVWLWHHNHKRALICISSFGAMGLLLFGMNNAITQGGFLMNIVVANINQYVLHQALAMGKQLSNIWPIIFITCVIIIILTIYTKFSTHLNIQVQTLRQDFLIYGLAFYSLGAIISSIMTIVKNGSNVNYFLELIAVCAIWIGLALRIILDQKYKDKLIFLGLFFFQMIWVLRCGYTLSQLTAENLWWKLDTYENLNNKVQVTVQKVFVLTDDFLDLVFLSGQPIYYQPFEYG